MQPKYQQITQLTDSVCDAHLTPEYADLARRVTKIRDLLKIDYFSHEWMLPSRIKTSSTAWLIMINGIVVDARTLSREAQEIAFEKGLIPYIPDDR